MNFEALSVSLRQMWHFNTVSKTKCQDGQEFQFSSLKDFCLVFPQQQSLQAASPASRSFLGNGELKLKLDAPSQMASRHKCLYRNQFIKISENSNSVPQSADSKLDSISKFWVCTLVFKALIQIQVIDKALICLPVSWQTIDTSEVFKQVIYLLDAFPDCLMKCCSVQPGLWALR